MVGDPNFNGEHKTTQRARIRLLVLVGLLLPLSAQGQDTARPAPVQPGQTQNQPEPNTYEFPSGKERAAYWVKRAMGPTAFVAAATGASWGTWVTNEPPEWGKRGEGFGRRVGNSLATTAINQTSLALISEVTRQDSAYYRCPCSGFGSRLKHVVKMTFMGRNRKGEMVFSPGKMISPFIGPMVTRNTLYPDRYGPGDAAVSGVYGIGAFAAWNFVYEFILPAKRW